MLQPPKPASPWRLLVFEKDGKDARQETEAPERREARLVSKVGQLTIELEWLKKVKGAGTVKVRISMIERDSDQLSIRRQCELADVNRNRPDPPPDNPSPPATRALPAR